MAKKIWLGEVYLLNIYKDLWHYVVKSFNPEKNIP